MANAAQTITASFRLSQMRHEIERAGLMSGNTKLQGNRSTIATHDHEQPEKHDDGIEVIDRVNALIDGAKPRVN